MQKGKGKWKKFHATKGCVCVCVCFSVYIIVRYINGQQRQVLHNTCMHIHVRFLKKKKKKNLFNLIYFNRLGARTLTDTDPFCFFCFCFLFFFFFFFFCKRYLPTYSLHTLTYTARFRTALMSW